MDSMTMYTKSRAKQELAVGIPPVECCQSVRLKRPRYFPGQLLTEAELTADQRYVMQRMGMHNRNMHGWGVACGLEVVCHPDCKGQVLVRPGHAISCCGKDIFVCETELFDVVGYLRERLGQCEPDCGPNAKEEPDPCAGAKRQYCLVLSPAEEKARPVTALIPDDGCRVNRCEPSLIIETFQLDLIQHHLLTCKREPTLAEQICKCIRRIEKDEILGNFISKLKGNLDYDGYRSLFCSFREYVQDLYTKNPHNVRCNICDHLSRIKFPGCEQQKQIDYDYVRPAFDALFGYVIQYLVDCICHKLLVRCPECRTDDHVVLACITMEGDVISHICNLSRRWHPSPLQRRAHELKAVEPLVSVVEKHLPKTGSKGTLEDRLTWMCCCADLTSIFVKNEDLTFQNLLEEMSGCMKDEHDQAKKKKDEPVFKKGEDM